MGALSFWKGRRPETNDAGTQAGGIWNRLCRVLFRPKRSTPGCDRPKLFARRRFTRRPVLDPCAQKKNTQRLPPGPHSWLLITEMIPIVDELAEDTKERSCDTYMIGGASTCESRWPHAICLCTRHARA